MSDDDQCDLFHYSRERSRAISDDAFAAFVASGLLGKRQRDVLVWVRKLGPVTAQELTTKSGIRGAWKRLPELARMGLIDSPTTKTCTVTGRTVQAWVLVSITPKEPPQ
jgi:hypothetical protein